MSDSRRSKMASFVRSASLTICPWSVASFATQRFSSTNRPVSFSSTALICPAEAATRFMFSRPSSDPVRAYVRCSCARTKAGQKTSASSPKTYRRLLCHGRENLPVLALDPSQFIATSRLHGLFLAGRLIRLPRTPQSGLIGSAETPNRTSSCCGPERLRSLASPDDVA